MIPIGLAASTASTLLQHLQGTQKAGQQGTQQSAAGGAAQQFGAQLDALMPGAGTALGGIAALGQDLLGTLGIGAQAYAANVSST